MNGVAPEDPEVFFLGAHPEREFPVVVHSGEFEAYGLFLRSYLAEGASEK